MVTDRKITWNDAAFWQIQGVTKPVTNTQKQNDEKNAGREQKIPAGSPSPSLLRKSTSPKGRGKT